MQENKISNSNGFSLVQVMVAGAIMTGLMYYNLQIIADFEKSNKIVTSKIEAFEIRSEIRDYFTDQSDCTASLSGMTFDNPSINKSMSVNGIPRYTTNQKFGNSRIGIVSYETTRVPGLDLHELKINYSIGVTPPIPYSRTLRVKVLNGNLPVRFSNPCCITCDLTAPTLDEIFDHYGYQTFSGPGGTAWRFTTVANPDGSAVAYQDFSNPLLSNNEMAEDVTIPPNGCITNPYTTTVISSGTTVIGEVEHCLDADGNTTTRHRNISPNPSGWVSHNYVDP